VTGEFFVVKLRQINFCLNYMMQKWLMLRVLKPPNRFYKSEIYSVQSPELCK